MADFVTKCPRCGMDVTAKSEWVGMNVACPGCQNNFTIQQPGAPVPPPQPQAMPGMNVPPPPPQQQAMPGMNVPPPPPPQQGFNQPYGAAPMTPSGINVEGSDWNIDYYEAQKVQKWYTIMWICFAASLITCGVTALVGVVFGFMLLYKFWKLIPLNERQDVATPREAVGLCFVAFYNYYWLFIAYRRLAMIYQRYTSAPITTYAMVFCCANIAGLIPYVGIISGLVQLVFLIMLFYNLKQIIVAMGNRSLNGGAAPGYGVPPAPGGYNNY